MELKIILLSLLYQIILDADLIICEPCPLVIKGEQIDGPKTSQDFNCWIKSMDEYRKSERQKINYDDVNYKRPELLWTQHNVLQPQMMVHDRDFYDPKTHQYTVDKYVDRLNQRYDGIDSVLVWPTYPNIGIDNRNTDDMIRDMPNGINGIKKMISDFQRHNIKVLFPIHPWDQGTRNPGYDWSVVLPKTMAELNADGLNGDTMGAVNKEYFDNSVKDARPLALEPEGGLSDNGISSLNWNVMSWGYWDNNSPRPKVSRNKWIETRHQVHVCDRWSKSKIKILQTTFFNGVGFETWENVWGIWNQMTDRDCQATKMVASILRKFSSLVTSDRWTPYYETIEEKNLVFASQWPGTGNSTLTLWTLINRSDKDINGSQLEVSHRQNDKYYDIWHGIELIPQVKNGKAILQFPIESHGFGAILSGEEKDLPKDFNNFTSKMKQYSARALSSYSSSNIVVKQVMVPIEQSKQYKSAPQGMVLIDAANYTFSVSGTEIEGGDSPGVDVQYQWESEPMRHHKHIIEIKKFYIDKTPVTNDQFHQFLTASKYSPIDNHNFLRDWHNGPDGYPDGWSNKPVTWVSIEDAREYCHWAGKRLPHEWEWQYAAQGHDGRKYPWGNTFDPSRVPTPVLGRNLSSPADVTQFANGASPFGVTHMVGNVWQWTDEYVDEHTRTAVVRGGSYYHAQGSHWYFPSNEKSYSLDLHNKYLLMAPSLDRAGTLGFRCAADA